MKALIKKADILLEALPYIQSFQGEIQVIKLGGSAIDNPSCCSSILADIAFLAAVGIKPVIIHGGGKTISRTMRKKGLKTRFIDGVRITDEKVVEVVEKVLNREINPAIVKELTTLRVKAQGIHGNKVLLAKKIDQTKAQGHQTDLGFVGTITEVNTALLRKYIQDSIIPVITPLGRDRNGQIYNVNADNTATAISGALKARKLVFLSDMPGILQKKDEPNSVIPTISESEVDSLINNNIIDTGMIPKIASALQALKHGVSKVHIIDGHLMHSLLLEIFTKKGIGTQIIHNDNNT